MNLVKLIGLGLLAVAGLTASLRVSNNVYTTTQPDNVPSYVIDSSFAFSAGTMGVTGLFLLTRKKYQQQ